VVRDGVTIGERSIVGMGSVVRHDVPDGVVAYGCPARVVRQLVRNGN
jgi:acetyltransferase-like isoleucine patch superfamily enzyme